jgi:hypothetical protein
VLIECLPTWRHLARRQSHGFRLKEILKYRVEPFVLFEPNNCKHPAWLQYLAPASLHPEKKKRLQRNFSLTSNYNYQVGKHFLAYIVGKNMLVKRVCVCMRMGAGAGRSGSDANKISLCSTALVAEIHQRSWKSAQRFNCMRPKSQAFTFFLELEGT